MTCPAKPPGAVSSKLLLLCHHAEDLALRSVAAIDAGRDDELAELQSRKFPVVEELTAVLVRFPPEDPTVRAAVARVETALRAELASAAAANVRISRELPALRAAEMRLSRIRLSYAHDQGHQGAGEPGIQLSVRG